MFGRLGRLKKVTSGSDVLRAAKASDTLWLHTECSSGHIRRGLWVALEGAGHEKRFNGLMFDLSALGSQNDCYKSFKPIEWIYPIRDC